MAQNKIMMTPDSSSEWLASCGFLFPSGKRELDRFHQLHGETDLGIIGDQVDPFKIIKVVAAETSPGAVIAKLEPADTHRLVAGKLGELPKHIVSLIKDSKLRNNDNKDPHQ